MAWVMPIQGDLIPESAAEIIGELQALFAGHNAGAALSAKAVFKPTKESHSARHRNNFELGMLNFEFLQLSAFQFQLFLPVVPFKAGVKTKLGRGWYSICNKKTLCNGVFRCLIEGV